MTVAARAHGVCPVCARPWAPGEFIRAVHDRDGSPRWRHHTCPVDYPKNTSEKEEAR